MENDENLRQQIVDEARKWLRTPYISNAMIIGPKGGVDCAMILVAVYKAVGIVNKDFDPRPYPPMWHLHKATERYMAFVQQFAHEISGPPSPGDIVMFKIARLFAHGGIVVKWPIIIHARAPNPVIEEDVSVLRGKHGLSVVEKKFYSMFES